MAPSRTTVARPSVILRAEPSANSVAVSELLFGETVIVSGTEKNGFVEVISDHDQYRGQMPTCDVSTETLAATHRVSVRSTLAFARADIKCPPSMRLPFAATICVVDGEMGKEWVQESTGLWLRQAHLRPIDRQEPNTPLDIAGARFMDAPYLWGGRTPDGCDCSGLVQVVHAARGINLPRDSGDQEQALSNQIDMDRRRQGDLVFWPGHVALLVDANTVRHANAYTLSVVDEPLSAVVDRAGAITSIRRPEHY